MVWDFCFYVLPLNLLNLNVAAGSPEYIVIIYKNLSIFQIFHGLIFIYFYLFFSDFFLPLYKQKQKEYGKTLQSTLRA